MEVTQQYRLTPLPHYFKKLNDKRNLKLSIVSRLNRAFTYHQTFDIKGQKKPVVNSGKFSLGFYNKKVKVLH